MEFSQGSGIFLDVIHVYNMHSILLVTDQAGA